MSDILETIIARKREEMARSKSKQPLRVLQGQVAMMPERSVLSMRAALEASHGGIIAEFKRKSPSKGWLQPDAEVGDIVPAYVRNGAAACSVLTDETFFGGTAGDLREARRLVHVPLLRKDFIIDAYQLYEAKLLGADAVLLIASVLLPEQCCELAQTARILGLEVLLEIHSEEELKHLNPFVDMLGVNNRNLGTFHTDVTNSQRMVNSINRHLQETGLCPLLIAESGIRNATDIKRLRAVGYRGFLIGEAFMQTPSPGETLCSLINELNDDDN